MWEVQASERPEFEVWQLSHGDVLVSEIPKKQKAPTTIAYGVQGSQRTIAALTVTKAKHRNSEPDPWEIADPWSQAEGPNKQPKLSSTGHQAKPMPPAIHVGNIASQVEERVMETVNKRFSERRQEEEDELMPDQTRIADLEGRLHQLEVTVQANQVAQANQVNALSTKVDAVQQQVDSQSESMKAHIDESMAAQLRHIEQLLLSNKAARKE